MSSTIISYFFNFYNHLINQSSRRRQWRGGAVKLSYPVLTRLSPLPHTTLSTMSEGIPIRLLHESVPHVVTVETTSGDIYRGTLSTAEDNMNVQMRKATRTRRDGRVTPLEHVFIRGSTVKLFILPDILASAPMFQRVQALKDGKIAESKGLGRGRGYAATLGMGAMGAAGRGRGAPRRPSDN